VKCDERKPKCARCESAKRDCTGYPSNAPTDWSSPATLSNALIPPHNGNQDLKENAPKYALTAWENATQERNRLVQLGAYVLGRDPYSLRTALGNAFWSSFLPQLSHGIAIVGVAVAAFDAAYEARFLQKADPTNELAVTKHYNYALKILSQHIQSQPHGTLPLVLTCTLLAAVETVRRNQTNALIHSQGAFNVWTTNKCKVLDRKYGHSRIDTHASTMLAGEDNFSLTLCRNLDLVIVSYSLRRAPALQAWTPSSLHTTTSSIEQAGELLAEILHSCFLFSSRASPFKYRPRAKVPFDLAIEQGRHISNLLFWLQNFQKNVVESPEFAQSPSNAAAHPGFILKAQCLFVLIYTSTISMTHETAYDNYAPEFLQIIECIEAALDQNELENLQLPPFSPTMGAVMPLCFTAVRCRNPSLRRRAISLLQIAGIEGPWNGLIEAAIATAIVRIEEERTAESGLEPPLISRPSEIREQNRVCRYAIVDESSEDNSLIYRITVEFFRCSDMDRMMTNGEDHADSSYWEVWQQELFVLS
jgi:hypothetical protein